MALRRELQGIVSGPRTCTRQLMCICAPMALLSVRRGVKSVRMLSCGIVATVRAPRCCERTSRLCLTFISSYHSGSARCDRGARLSTCGQSFFGPSNHHNSVFSASNATKHGAFKPGKFQLSFALLFSSIRTFFYENNFLKISLQFPAGHMQLLGRSHLGYGMQCRGP